MLSAFTGWTSHTRVVHVLKCVNVRAWNWSGCCSGSGSSFDCWCWSEGIYWLINYSHHGMTKSVWHQTKDLQKYETYLILSGGQNAEKDFPDCHLPPSDWGHGKTRVSLFTTIFWLWKFACDPEKAWKIITCKVQVADTSRVISKLRQNRFSKEEDQKYRGENNQTFDFKWNSDTVLHGCRSVPAAQVNEGSQKQSHKHQMYWLLSWMDSQRLFSGYEALWWNWIGSAGLEINRSLFPMKQLNSSILINNYHISRLALSCNRLQPVSASTLLQCLRVWRDVDVRLTAEWAAAQPRRPDLWSRAQEEALRGAGPAWESWCTWGKVVSSVQMEAWMAAQHKAQIVPCFLTRFTAGLQRRFPMLAKASCLFRDVTTGR